MARLFDRREFLGTAGAAGLTLAFGLPDGDPAAAANAFEPNAWLTIASDGVVTVHIVRAEMGQGIGTALAQIVAEELEVDWKDVRLSYPVNDPKYGRLMHTVGSLSVKALFEPLSRAGAAARMLLIDAAARDWNVAPAACVAQSGVVHHHPTGRAISYGDLVARTPITKTLTADELKAIQLKSRPQYRLIGTSLPRLDIPEKVDGRATYAIDVFLPGMAYAKVAYPPTRGGTHRTVDDVAARRVKGHVRTVVTDDLVAIVAETYEAAVEARDALKITWEPGPHARIDSRSIAADYERRARQQTGPAWVKVGDVDTAMNEAARTHAATYTTDFAEQAPMEPMSCVARWIGDRCELYTGVQSQLVAVAQLSRTLGIPPDNVRIHQQYLGGGFGRRLDVDVPLEAALIARAAGRPIKLIRSREEDFARGFYRTPTLHAMHAGLDATGRVLAWRHAVVAASPLARWGFRDAQGRDQTLMLGADHQYEIPHQLAYEIPGEHGIPVGMYRAVGAGCTWFAVESFVDEVARRTGRDPLAMRLGMLATRPRLVNVLKLAATGAGWGTPLPPDVGRGLACTTYRDRDQPTWTAAVVQARVDRGSGAIQVQRITCVVDCGLVINPDGARAQLEGGLLFGVSAAVKEYGSIRDGAFVQKNFEDYPILRMDEVPEVDIHVVDSKEAPTGTGEQAVTVVAPALANAIFAATGARVRQLPFLPDRVLKALADKP